jgi:hypothetical protein
VRAIQQWSVPQDLAVDTEELIVNTTELTIITEELAGNIEELAGDVETCARGSLPDPEFVAAAGHAVSQAA